jgi:predicted Zn-dependent peptidase
MNKPDVFKLDSGLTCVIINNPHVGSVTTHLRGSCGSNLEGNNQIGASHLLEHYIAASNRELSNKISFTGGYFVGVTSREDTLFMTKTVKDHVDLALDYNANIFNINEFNDQIFETQKKIVGNEIDRIFLNPERLMLRERNRILFKNDRMQKFNIGSKEDVSKLKIEGIKDFYEQFYTIGRFVLVIAGNVNNKKIKASINKKFGNIFSKKSERKEIKLIKDPDLKVLSIKHLNNKQFICNIDFYTSPIGSKEHILDNLAAGLINEALNAIVKTKHGLVYQIRCTNFASSHYGKISINYFSSKENGAKVLKNVSGVIKDIATKFEDPKILARVEAIKNQYISRMTFNMEKTSALADYYSYRYVHNAYIKNHMKEVDAVKKVKPKEIFKKIKEISVQPPKITLVTDRRIDDEKIRNLWSFL